MASVSPSHPLAKQPSSAPIFIPSWQPTSRKTMAQFVPGWVQLHGRKLAKACRGEFSSSSIPLRTLFPLSLILETPYTHYSWHPHILIIPCLILSSSSTNQLTFWLLTPFSAILFMYFNYTSPFSTMLTQIRLHHFPLLPFYPPNNIVR